MERWKLNRAGLFNYWYYNDDTVFDFTNGKLLIRGANGTGKSLTTQSLLPFLLDGKKSPERLDSFGSRARKMEDYLFGDHEVGGHTERTGYLYLEFFNERIERYITIGACLHGKRGEGSLNFRAFVITDNRRIGHDFKLYHQADQVKTAIKPWELKQIIGDGGYFVKTQKEYMELVNKYLFGFPTIEAFDGVIKLMLQLRSPKLNRDAKPSDVFNILSESLPTLSDRELLPLSETIESLEQLQMEISQLKSEFEAIDKVCEKYQLFNNNLLRKRAGNVVTSFQAYQKAYEKEIELQKSFDSLNQKHQDVSKSLIEVEQLLEANEAAKGLLKVDPGLLEKETILINIQSELNKLRNDIDSLKNDLVDLENQLATNHQEESQIREEISFNDADISSQRKRMIDLAETAHFGAHQLLLTEKIDQTDKGLIDVTYQSANEHQDLLTRICNDFESRNKLHNDLQDSQKNFMEAQNKYQSSLTKLQNVQADLDKQRSKWINELKEWNKSNKALVLEDFQMDYYQSMICNFPEENTQSEFRSYLQSIYQEKFNKLTKRNLQVQKQFSDSEELLKEANNELSDWVKTKTPYPSRDISTKYNREKIIKEKVPFVPFFEVVRFRSDVPLNIKIGIEAALLKSGILDSLIGSDLEQYKDFIQNDRVLIPELVTGPTLIDYLEPEEDLPNFINGDFVKRILSSIKYGTESSSTSVNHHGEFVTGIVYGKSDYHPRVRFIGKTERNNFWMETKLQLENALAEIQKEYDSIEKEQFNIQILLQEIWNEFERFPCLDYIQSKFADLKLSEQSVEQAKDVLNRADETVKKHIQKLNVFQSSLNDLIREFIIRDEKDFKIALGAIKDYLSSFRKWKDYIELKQRRQVELSKIESIGIQLKDNVKGLTCTISEKERDLSSKMNKQKVLEEELADLGLGDIREKSRLILSTIENLEKRREELIRESTRCEEGIKAIDGSLKEAIAVKESREILLKCYQSLYLSEQNYQIETIKFPSQETTDYPLVAKHAEAILREIPEQVYEESLSETYLRFREKLYNYRLTLQHVTVNVGKVKDEDLANYVLGVYPLEWKDIQDSSSRRVLTVNYGGKWISLFTLRDSLKLIVEEKEKYLLKKEEEDLIQEAILKNVGRTIRRKIRESESWIIQMNKVMSTCSMGNGLKLVLHWRPKNATNEDELDTVDLVKLLSADPLTLEKSEYERLTKHFKRQVKIAKERFEEETEGISFYQILTEMLDYRNWFSFAIRYKKSNESWKELTNQAFFQFSGGEKATVTYVPLLSAMHSRYQQARKDAPRIITLDEAFAGISDDNISKLFLLLEQLDFDYVMNSQSLWGDFPTVKGLSICELIRHDNADFVTIDRYKWNGISLESVDNL